MIKINKKNELLGNARSQRYWAALAMRDKKYSLAQSKRMRKLHENISARDFEREAHNCGYWAHKRMRWAGAYERKARRMK